MVPSPMNAWSAEEVELEPAHREFAAVPCLETRPAAAQPAVAHHPEELRGQEEQAQQELVGEPARP